MPDPDIAVHPHPAPPCWYMQHADLAYTSMFPEEDPTHLHVLGDVVVLGLEAVLEVVQVLQPHKEGDRRQHPLQEPLSFH